LNFLACVLLHLPHLLMMTCAAQPFMASFSAEVNRERLLYELLVDVKLPRQCEDGKKVNLFAV